MRIVVIGIGNPDCGDDAAGVLVARRLRELGVDAWEQRGAALEVIEAWSGADAAILVDAVMTGAPTGTAGKWDGDTVRVLRNRNASSHGFGLAEAVELARALGRLPPTLRIYGIEGRSFEPGSGPSPEVLESVELVSRQILAEMHGWA